MNNVDNEYMKKLFALCFVDISLTMLTMEMMDVEVVATAEHERARGETPRDTEEREDAESRLVLREWISIN